MAKIICNDGTEEYLSPGAARAKVAAGEAVYAQNDNIYATRQMKAKDKSVPVVEAVVEPEEEPVKKPKRKRRTKAEIAADAENADDET